VSCGGLFEQIPCDGFIRVCGSKSLRYERLITQCYEFLHEWITPLVQSE